MVVIILLLYPSTLLPQSSGLRPGLRGRIFLGVGTRISSWVNSHISQKPLILVHHSKMINLLNMLIWVEDGLTIYWQLMSLTDLSLY